MALGTYSKEFAFTVTLHPKLYKYKIEEQYDMTQSMMVRRLNDLSEKYTLVAEVTKNGNLHYHGIIKFLIKKETEDLRYRFHNVFRNQMMFGHRNIKEVTELSGWIEYLTKGFQPFQDNFMRSPILQDNLEVFTGEQILCYHINPRLKVVLERLPNEQQVKDLNGGN